MFSSVIRLIAALEANGLVSNVADDVRYFRQPFREQAAHQRHQVVDIEDAFAAFGRREDRQAGAVAEYLLGALHAQGMEILLPHRRHGVQAPGLLHGQPERMEDGHRRRVSRQVSFGVQAEPFLGEVGPKLVGVLQHVLKRDWCWGV
jgi:hypothetical protein